MWQRSMQLTVAVYRLTKDFPRDELYGLTSQIRRAAVSLPSNIAEGHGRLNSAEFKQFLGVARGSNSELQTHLEIARALGMGNPQLLNQAEGLSREIGKMIFATVQSLGKRAAANRSPVSSL